MSRADSLDLQSAGLRDAAAGSGLGQPDASHPVARLRGVTLTHANGRIGIEDVSLDVLTGRFHVLLGPSGAGKSSLLRALALLLRPSSGTLEILDQDVASAKPKARAALRRRVGAVFQDFRLMDHLSVYENIALPLRLDRRPRRVWAEEVADLARFVGLGDVLQARPTELSGGERQRVAIARAMVAKPAILLADEPTANLDIDLAERLVRLFREVERRGTAVVMATHDEAIAAEPHVRVIRLDRGRVVQKPQGAL